MARLGYSNARISSIQGAICEAAFRVLARVGDRGSTLRAVGRELGWTSAALCRYFPSKDDLLADLRVHGFHRMEATLSGARRRERNHLESVKNLIRAYASSMSYARLRVAGWIGFRIRLVFSIALCPIAAVSLPSIAFAGAGGPPPHHVDGAGPDGSGLFPNDRIYALGQTIFEGKNRRVRGPKVCFSIYEAGDDAPRAVRLSRSVLKGFRGRPVVVFATRLVDCEAVGSQIALVLDRLDFRALVYFLNKRFHLRLRS